MIHRYLQQLYHRITSQNLTPDQTLAEVNHWLTIQEKDLNVIGWRLEEMALNHFLEIYDQLETLIIQLQEEGHTTHAMVLINTALQHIPNLEQLCIVEMEAADLRAAFENLTNKPNNPNETDSNQRRLR